MKNLTKLASKALVIIMLGLSPTLQAQIPNSWELGGGAGVSNYQGDLVPTYYYSYLESEFAFNFYIKKYFSPF